MRRRERPALARKRCYDLRIVASHHSAHCLEEFAERFLELIIAFIRDVAWCSDFALSN